ncbi:MAG: FumA C-terminus/TtdB family hydratase beta subunit [Fusobacterium gastrosuis]|uniref:FumA C-terminus/TtdB family hydratase beta subunit n=1 Tax=Fusobacterium TaxID=848 RepID=UPI0025BC57F9|nr:FumA C-terminus/TtdB family hydratase beta subunit [Fusobacterium sp.]MCI7223238.1 FumA C-terminus/TtdB family hydratase beta subunit [Fusobacterium sp.]MDD7391229.1 FumA C-terminus/TtdB family hydratase beta subunit [Fusobacteriaceae bacterium]MDY4010532.1 FumA C-terminus/TtdB family hydratase beta subunit [Fusobacterium gastrosuis]
MSIIELKTPLKKEDIKKLKIGDIVELTGTIYTARDAAHKRMKNAFENNLEQPIDFSGQLIFYAGPCPVKPGRTMGSIAPTTSMRMDSYVEMTFKLGMLGMIGKGDRADYVSELCKKYEGVYFLSIGGASAMISDQVKKCDVVAYEDLGTESIKRLEVEKLRLIVGIDSEGRVFQKEEIKKYRK